MLLLFEQLLLLEVSIASVPVVDLEVAVLAQTLAVVGPKSMRASPSFLRLLPTLNCIGDDFRRVHLLGYMLVRGLQATHLSELIALTLTLRTDKALWLELLDTNLDASTALFNITRCAVKRLTDLGLVIWLLHIKLDPLDLWNVLLGLRYF